MPMLAGALAALGATALLAPLVLWAVAVFGVVATAYLALGVQPGLDDVLWGAVPLLIALVLVSLIAGLVAGALSRTHRATQGGSAALLGLLLVALLVLGLAYAELGGLAGVYVVTLLLGAPLAALSGRLGAVLVPERVEIREVAPAPRAEPRPAFRMLPAVGRKGGDVEAEPRREEREREPIERRVEAKREVEREDR